MNKSKFIRKQFDHLANRFELMNQVMTLGIINKWRSEFSNFVQVGSHWKVLDIGSAEGISALKIKNSHPDTTIFGLDTARSMLKKNQLNYRIQGDIEELPFRKEIFDAAVCAFGFRNFNNLEQAVDNFNTVLKPNGILYLIEFSTPTSSLLRIFYRFYIKHVIPLIGTVLTRHSEAYHYLSESIIKFPARADFLAMMKECDFNPVVIQPLTFGIVTMYAFQKLS